MKLQYFKQSLLKQFIISNLSVIFVALICYISVDFIGYRSVALLLLATVSILAIFFSLFPVLMAATMSALIWDYFFIPPHFTFYVSKSEDILLLIMYFVIALINGVFTSRVRQFEKLERQKEERHNTIKLYKTLFDSLSHELRTPISTIVGATDNLMQKESNISNVDKSELVGQISTSALRLNRLIDNLLNMQRLESGMLKIKPVWCEISELINSPLNWLEKELSTHNMQVEIQEDFPIVKLDAGLIEQALFNVLHNETLYTSPDSTISVQVNYKNGCTTIVISDNGKGFTDEDLTMLFTKFYRSGTKVAGGTGLGLSIVKGFVEAHGGTIKVENNIPHGAKFSIEIPTETLKIDDYLSFSNANSKVSDK